MDLRWITKALNGLNIGTSSFLSGYPVDVGTSLNPPIIVIWSTYPLVICYVAIEHGHRNS